MNTQGCTILLRHEDAQAFFEETLHPNLAVLERRDAFFKEIDGKISGRTEGTDLVEDIPDIDISSLLGCGKAYRPLKQFLATSIQSSTLSSIEIASILINRKDAESCRNDYPVNSTWTLNRANVA